MLDRGQVPGGHLDHSQLEQDLRGLRLSRFLLQRPPEPADRRVGSGPPQGLIGGGHQRLCGPDRFRWTHGGQVGRYLLRRRAFLGQGLSRGRVGGISLGDRELVISGAAHERVDEGERILG